MSRYIVDLDSRTALSPERVGGKGAGLNWLARQGFRVPAGFIVTTDAFEDHAFADHTTGAPLPVPVAHAIHKAYRRLGGRVAVRSSLTAEDSPEMSFAGQFDTLLDLAGEEAVLDAVGQCWDSLSSGRAAAYLQQHEVSHGAHRMAVVVQRMIEPTAAGVAFSADPLTGESHVIIEGAFGRGDAVVSGRKATDRFVIDARSVMTEASPQDPSRPVLTEVQVLELARTVRDIERRAGSPQDIEWAWDDTGLHLLQTRPITTLRNQHIYSRRIVGEMAPGLIKPLVYEVNILPMGRHVFGRLFTELLGAQDADYGALVPLLYSRVYADMTLMNDLFERAGLPPNLVEMMYQEERARRRMKMTPAMLRPMGRMTAFAAHYARIGRRAPDEIAARNAFLDSYRPADWSSLPADALLTQLKPLIAERNAFHWLFFLVTMSMVLRTGFLRHWTHRQAPDVPFSDLIRGLTGLKGLEPMAEIEHLARKSQDLSAGEIELLQDGDEAAIRAGLAASPVGRELIAGVDGFLTRFGYLGSNGSDFSVTTWEENPLLIWRAVSRGASQPAPASSRSVAEIREEALQRVLAHMNRTLFPAYNRLFASVVEYVALREQVSLLISEYSYQMRRLHLAIADRLLAQGALTQRDDIFYLTTEELDGLVAQTLSPRSVEPSVAARRAALETDAALTPPDILRGAPGNLYLTSPAMPQASEYLSGIGGSSGCAAGRARIVNDPAHAPATLGRDDILVVPYSDVGWTPLFPGIGGVVAETGGQLSHTAIVAREYGLPAVVSVKGATRLIHDGQFVRVDGNHGRVYLES